MPQSKSAKPKRILMLLENSGFPEDGRVASEAFVLAEAGYSVRVICPKDKYYKKRFEVISGVPTYRYPRPPEWGGFLGYVLEYGYSLTATLLISIWIFLRHGFDVLHVHTPPDMYVAIGYIYRILGVKYVQDHHDLSPELYQGQTYENNTGIVYKVLRWFERRSCRLASQIIATNETQRRIEIERCGVLPERTNVVRNGPPLDRFRQLEPLAELRAEGHTTFGYLGCIGYQDGVDQFIHSLHSLKTDFNRDDFIGVIIGDGPAVSDLKSLTKELGIEDKVHFAGYQRGESLLRHLSSCDVGVTPDPPSAYNMTCTMIKTMDYMAMSLPIVGFDMPEHRYSAGEASLYALPGDQNDLARCMKTLMDDPEERKRRGVLGRQRVENELAWKFQAKSLLNTYSKLFGVAELAQS